MKKWVFLLFAFLLCINVFSQQLIINDDEKVLNASEKEFIENAVAYEISFYNQIFPQDPFFLTDVSFNIFKKYDQYLAYQAQARGAVHYRSLGYYSFTEKEVVVCKEKQQKGQFLKTCAHELSHFLLMQRMNAPIWLNEGLATYFGNMKFSSKNTVHNKNKYLIARIKTMIELRDIDLQDFVTWDHGKFGKMSFSNDNYGYAIAYGIIFFLMNESKDVTMNLIREIGKNQSTADAFDICYTGGFVQFEKDFIAYYSNGK